jgi:hypothetical protein
VPYYETAAECEGALEPAMFALAVRHPQVFGQCVAVDPADEEADVELVWEIATDGTFIASLEPSGIMIASAGEGDGNRN